MGDRGSVVVSKIKTTSFLVLTPEKGGCLLASFALGQKFLSNLGTNPSPIYKACPNFTTLLSGQK